MTASPYGTLVASPDAVIIDAQGNVWSIQNGQVVENGVPDPTTANVIALAYAFTVPFTTITPVVWQENASRLWWFGGSAGWSPAGGTATAPVSPSRDGTAITSGDPTPILDANSNIWTISNGQAVKNGVVDPTTANVIEMEYKGGYVWQENADQLWWSYGQASDGSTVWTPGMLPIARAWIGGDDNNASNPNDWSPTGVPGLGDTLTMTSGTMNICGNALLGDTLTIPALSKPFTATVNLQAADVSISARQGGNTIDVNVSGGTSNLALNALMDTVNVTVAPDSTLIMNYNVSLSTLNVSGGTIKFIGSNYFSGFETVFNDSLVGTGSIVEYGGNAAGEFMEVNGPVGCGLTFDLSSYLDFIGGPRDVGLQIDRPNEFHGTIGSMDGFVAFMGLHATSGEILNGMLKLFDGGMLVDAIRYTGPTSSSSGDVLQLQQNSAGVMFSIGHGETYQPGGNGTAIPLTIQS